MGGSMKGRKGLCWMVPPGAAAVAPQSAGFWLRSVP